MSKRKPSKVYYKESTIEGSGKGLFAKEKINKGNIIVEFKGTLRSPGMAII